MPAGGERVGRAPSAGGEGKCVRRGSPPSAHSLWSKHQLRRGKGEGKKNRRKLPSRKCSSRVCLSPELPPAGEELRLIADADRPDPGNSHHFPSLKFKERGHSWDYLKRQGLTGPSLDHLPGSGAQGRGALELDLWQEERLGAAWAPGPALGAHRGAAPAAF